MQPSGSAFVHENKEMSHQLSSTFYLLIEMYCPILKVRQSNAKVGIIASYLEYNRQKASPFL